MRAIQVVGEAKESRLELGEEPEPGLRTGELAIDVVATAVNRADLLQRMGLYPPPAGASTLLGLECAGIVTEMGPEAAGFEIGDRVMALLPGGGYAEKVTVDAGSVMPVPKGLPLTHAAAIPEVFLTCYLNLFQLADVQPGDWVLVHGGGSGIGTAAICLLKAAGAHVIVTCGSDDKCERCLALGADAAFNYREGPFEEGVKAQTGGQGIAVVLDSIGAPYLKAHLACMQVGGRLVLIGLMGGARCEINLGTLVAKRLGILGSTLRTRSLDQKRNIVSGFVERFGSALGDGSLAPIIDRVLPLADAQAAHEIVERSEHFGKVVLQVRDEA